MAKTTVYDIASALNISPSTVSRVLNNSSLISDEKKELILRTAEEMQYERRVIKKQGARAILNIRLFLPQSQFSYMNLFYDVAELADSIRSGFNGTKINIILTTDTNNDAIFDHKKTGETDGCVFAFCIPGPPLKKRLQELEIPFVLLNRAMDGCNHILVDNHAGMMQLVGAMHRRHGSGSRFCYVGFEPLAKLSNIRATGIQQACQSLGIPFSDEDCYSLDTISHIYEIGEDLIRKQYNGILCFNDVVAVSCYNMLLHHNIDVPLQVSLSGFDSSPILCLVDQPIDTVEFSVKALGINAGKWLKDRIIEKDGSDIHLSLPGKYIVGTTI